VPPEAETEVPLEAETVEPLEEETVEPLEAKDAVDVDVAVAVEGLQEVDTPMRRVNSPLVVQTDVLAFHNREDVLANRDKDTDQSYPRGRARGGRGYGGSRGREYERHSATGRVYMK
jgi:hypothetical protein